METLQDEWSLFPEMDYSSLEELFYELYFDKDDPPLFLSSYVEDEKDFYGISEDQVDKFAKGWQEFCYEIIHNNRYFPQRIINLEYIKNLLKHSNKMFGKGNLFYRARISGKTKYSKDVMGKPPSEKSKLGRANPKGIPYLYLASDRSTAISEVHPNLTDFVTVGEFSVIENISIAELANPYIDSPFKYGEKVEEYLVHFSILRKLGEELSKPINPKVAELSYIPLQYLCEFIKTLGYDGISYKSSVGTGDNLAIFSDYKLECISTELFSISGVNYEYRKVKVFDDMTTI